ncbi:efflux RND transporter permease subunit [Marinobacter lacisalsi]|uniref:Efflux RND transporter permease subunit n=1 Tax=Marinobacter lacisalsi TaxID=475979 RepID=A0ABV8QFB6_9GAMM
MFRSIEWFTRNPAVANLLALLLLVGGFLAIPQTRQETLPNLPLDRIGVVAKLQGASPEVIEQTLCSPLETALYTIEGIDNIRSESREGLCSITVDVVEGYDSGEVRNRMAARVETLNTLPPDAEEPVVEEAVYRNRVARLLVVADAKPRALHQVAWQLRDQLLDHPSIVDVELEGLPAREVALEVAREDLYRYDLTFAGVADAISRNLGRASGGMLRGPSANSLILSGEAVTDPEDYRDVTVRRTGEGERLVLGDFAFVRDGFTRDAMAAWFNGRPAVALDVYRIGDQDVVETAEAVHRFVRDATLPRDMELILWRDDSRQYRDRSDLLWKNALQGLIMLILLLALFFGLRLSAWVGLGIPVAMVGACIILPLTGFSFNTISLFAFILVLGIVVDDAVIVGESVDDQARRLGPGIDAVLEGVRRVALPITVAVVTTAIGFLPMMFLPGPEGDLMRVVPVVAITVLALSLVESLWILPSHLAHSMSRSRAVSGRFSQRVNRWFDGQIRRRVLPFMGAALNARMMVLLLFLSMFGVCVALLHSGWLSVTFQSQVTGNKVMVDVEFPPGTSSQRVLRATETLQVSAQFLSSTLEKDHGEPVIDDIYVEQGRRNNHSTAHDPGAYLRARVTVAMVGGDLPVTPDQVREQWRRLQPEIAGAVSMRFHSTINRVLPDLHVNLYHPDLDRLAEMSQALEQELREISGVFEVANGMSSRFSEINLAVRPGARLGGVTEAELGDQVQSAFQGIVIDQLPQGDHDVPVVLRLPAEQSNSLGHLEQLPIRLSDDSVAPLVALAEPQRRERPAVIQHYDRNRSVSVTAYVDTRLTSPGRVMAFLQEGFLAELAQQWPGARWSVAGKPISITRFVNHLTIGYSAALLAMFFVLTMMFGRYWQPLLILMAIPFGMVGAFLGHMLLGFELTLWSIIGVVAVSGVVINDNLVLIDHANHLRARYETQREALLEALAGRIRPIMLTTLTTSLAVAPLAFETSPQAAFLVPMAISLGFGVLFASLTTIFMVPSMIMIAEDVVKLIRRLRVRGHTVSERDSVEEAYRVGLQTADSGHAENPYENDVLRASWEAGVSDGLAAAAG